MEVTTRGEKVKTADDVAKIFAADRQITSLDAAWFRAMQNNDHIKAQRLRWEARRIKREILATYDIIL